MNRRSALLQLAGFIGSTGLAASAFAANQAAIVRQIVLTMTRGKGKAKYKEDRGKRELEVEVEGIAAAVGTVLTVTINSVSVGTMTVVSVANVRRAKLSRNTQLGQTVPVIAAGASIAVLNGTVAIGIGTF